MGGMRVWKITDVQPQYEVLSRFTLIFIHILESGKSMRLNEIYLYLVRSVTIFTNYYCKLTKYKLRDN